MGKVSKFFSTINSVFISASLLLIAIWLFTGKWKCNPAPSHDQEAAQQASSMKGADSIKKAHAHYDDSLIALKDNALQVADSILILKNNFEKLVNLKEKEKVMLATQVQLAHKHNDTVLYVESCDTLADRIIQQQGVISHYEDLNKQLFDSLQSINAYLGNLSVDHQLQINQLYDSLKTSYARYNSLFNDYKKVSGKASKSWSVGLGAMYGISADGKLQPTIGISIIKKIFSF